MNAPVSIRPKVKLFGVEYNLTEHCNLSCYQCDHASPLMPKKFASLADFERDIRAFAEAAHVEEFRLVGGEPLLHAELLEFVVKEKMRIEQAKKSKEEHKIWRAEMDAKRALVEAEILKKKAPSEADQEPVPAPFKRERQQKREEAERQRLDNLELQSAFFIDFRIAPSAQPEGVTDSLNMFRTAHTWYACQAWFEIHNRERSIAPLSSEDHRHVSYPRLDSEAYDIVNRFVQEWNARNTSVKISILSGVPKHLQERPRRNDVPWGWGIVFENE